MCDNLASMFVAMLLRLCSEFLFSIGVDFYLFFFKSSGLLLKKYLQWQMFTNGMSESSSSKVYLSDVSPKAFRVMLEFMYTGELSLEDTSDFGTLLLQLLLLADQFGVTLLYQECCKTLLECLSEVVNLYLAKQFNPEICFFRIIFLFCCYDMPLV